MLAFIADQLRIDPDGFGDYAQRDETRREHLGELQASVFHLFTKVVPFAYR